MQMKSSTKGSMNSIRFLCPMCKSSISSPEKDAIDFKLRCGNCSYEDDAGNEILEVDKTNSKVDHLYNLKNLIKRFPRAFLVLGYLFGPLLPIFQIDVYAALKRIRGSQGILGLNLGSGTSNFGDDIINIDFFKYKNVDLVADITKLPLVGTQFDIAILTEVIEHLPHPELVIGEVSRVLKKNGFILITSPFMIGFHGSPNDFQRFTIPGLKLLLKDFEILETKSYGPTGSLLWIFQEWCALWLSFGNKKAHTFWLIFFMLFTAPIKIVDLILNLNPMSANIASTFYVLAQKK